MDMSWMKLNFRVCHHLVRSKTLMYLTYLSPQQIFPEVSCPAWALPWLDLTNQPWPWQSWSPWDSLHSLWSAWVPAPVQQPWHREIILKIICNNITLWPCPVLPWLHSRLCDLPELLEMPAISELSSSESYHQHLVLLMMYHCYH